MTIPAVLQLVAYIEFSPDIISTKEDIMRKTLLHATLVASTVASILALGSGLAAAADQQQTQTQEQAQERIYGHDLMTEQERNEYRTRMRAAKTTAEREKIRAEHHDKMKVRAKEKGVTLPDEPPMGSGMGPGGGMGGGMGPGKGRPSY
jgi:hypothetical protein